MIEFRFDSFHSVTYIRTWKANHQKDWAQPHRENSLRIIERICLRCRFGWLSICVIISLGFFFRIVPYILHLIHWVSSKSQFRMVLTSTSPFLFVPFFVRRIQIICCLPLHSIRARSCHVKFTYMNCMNFQSKHILCAIISTLTKRVTNVKLFHANQCWMNVCVLGNSNIANQAKWIYVLCVSLKKIACNNISANKHSD